MAQNIWNQLSQYAKDRILNVLVHSLKLNHNWYERLNDQSNTLNAMFRDEYDIAKQSEEDKEMSVAAFAYKSDLNVLLVYLENGKEKEVENCRIVGIDGQGISVRMQENESIQIRKEDIISIIPSL